MNKKTLNILLPSRPYPELQIYNNEQPGHFWAEVYLRAANIIGLNAELHETARANNSILNNLKLTSYKFFQMRDADDRLFAVWQGNGTYGSLAGKLFNSKLQFILNTYKVPFKFHQNLKKRLNDALLCEAIKKASCVITVSYRQAEEIKTYNRNSAWIPFASDKDWWMPGTAEKTVLQQYGVKFTEYVLVMGDVDRDEETTAMAIKNLNYPVLRVTRDPKTAHRAERAWSINGISNSKILQRVPYLVLREIYRGARIIIIPSISNIHPAGLTSMTEAMCCAKPVIIPAGLTTELYVQNQVNAFVLDKWQASDIKDKVVSAYETDNGNAIGLNARKTIEENINFHTSAVLLANFLKQFIN